MLFIYTKFDWLTTGSLEEMQKPQTNVRSPLIFLLLKEGKNNAQGTP